jgi:hypothetical protein
MGTCCPNKNVSHKRDDLGHVIVGQYDVTCWINGKPCSLEQSNDSCVNNGYAEKNTGPQICVAGMNYYACQEHDGCGIFTDCIQINNIPFA